MTTIEDIEKIDRPYLIVKDIAPLFGADPHTLRCSLKEQSWRCGFPILECGNRLKIPKEAFIRWWKFETSQS